MYVSTPLIRMEHATYVWYMSVTAAVPVSEARRDLASIIDRVRVEHEPVYLAQLGVHGL
jgi:hypothetical protein